MADQQTLGQRIVEVAREYGDVLDPDKPHLVTLHMGDLEAIVDEHLEWWLMHVYDGPDPTPDA